MAAPHAAGVAALVIASHPDFVTDEVHSVLRAAADDIGTPEFDQYAGYGRLNAARAVTVDSPCVAFIHSPAPGASLFDPTIVPVIGTADGSTFQNYTLEVGNGTTPSSWTIIATGGNPVQNDVLGNWDISQSNDGFFTLRLTVANTSGEVFRAYNQIMVYQNLHEGWPQNFGYFEFSAALGDLDGDGQSDMVFSTMIPDQTIALTHDGAVLPGWPVDWQTLEGPPGSPTNPAVGDLNGDDNLEVVVGTWRSPVYAFHGDGTVVAGWPQGPRSSSDNEMWFFGDPTLADLDRDGSDEVIVGVTRQTITPFSYASFLYVWRGDGTQVPGWPVQLPLSETRDGFGMPIVGVGVVTGDVTGDGFPEIGVIQKIDGIWRETWESSQTACILFDSSGAVLPGWPNLLPLGWLADLLPVFGDLTGDGRPELIFSSERNEFDYDHWARLYALQPDGTSASGWPINMAPLNPSLSFPTLGDLTGDGLPEVIVIIRQSNTNKIAVYQGNGSALPGWPIQIDNTNLGVPLVADIDGDTGPDLITGGYNAVYAVNSAGQVLPGWPKPLIGYSNYSPTIGDVDGDGNVELLVGGGVDSKLLIYDLDGPADAQSLQWPMLLHDSRRSGHYNPPPLLIPIGDKIVKEGEFLSFMVSALDSPGDSLTYTTSALPGGAIFNDQTFSWAPSFAQAGNYSVTFTVSDGEIEDNETITITVSDVPNLLVNPDFSQNKENWNFPKNGSIDSAVWRTASKSAKVVNTGTINSTPGGVAITPGQSYQVGGWINLEGIANVAGTTAYGARVRVQVYDAAGTLLGSGVIVKNLKGTQDWTYYTKRFMAPPKAASARIQLQIIGSGTTGTAWFDGLLGRPCDDACATVEQMEI
jgi:hypothetical protein